MEANAQQAVTNTKEKLIAAATGEFAAHGYSGASLRKVCAAAGVTTGALYFFFRNKEDLFRSVVSPVLDPISHALERGGADGSSPAETMRSLLRQGGDSPVIDHLLKLCYGERTAVLIMISNRETPVVAGAYSDTKAHFARYIRQYADESGFSRDVWDELAVDWLAGTALDSVIEVLRMDGSIEDARAHARVLAGFLRGGIEALAQA